MKKSSAFILVVFFLSLTFTFFQNASLPSQPSIYGVCAITGGVGKHLTPVFITTQDGCTQRCNQLAQFANRKCYFKAHRFHASDQHLCTVRGGADKILFGPAPTTYNGCLSECSQRSGNVYRRCSLGDQDFYSPPASSRCEIKGGMGKWLQAPFYGTQSYCQQACDAKSANTNRSCRYGNTYLKTPVTHQICVIRGSGQRYLQPTAFLSQSQCISACQSHSQRESCKWGGSDVTNAEPHDQCLVQGGAGKTLFGPAPTSRSGCQSECNQRSGNAYRRCSFAGQDFHSPPESSLCEIRGGAGKLLHDTFYGSQNICQQVCDAKSANPNRSCRYGNVDLKALAGDQSQCLVQGGAGKTLFGPASTSRSGCQSECDKRSGNAYRRCTFGGRDFQSPPDSSRCEIKGGAGKWLRDPFYGTKNNCQQACDAKTANPNRSCRYGNTYLKR